MLIHPERWKSLHDRYQEDRPHRMLSLDGGGIRGLITLGIVERIEKLVQAKTGRKLWEYFDYIAGTSTGAIIAAGLARGMTSADLINFYIRVGVLQFFIAARFVNLAVSLPQNQFASHSFGKDSLVDHRGERMHWVGRLSPRSHKGLCFRQHLSRQTCKGDAFSSSFL
jgi:hypothetical protein